MWSNHYYKHPWIRLAAHAGFWIGYLFVNVLAVSRFYPERPLLSLLAQYSLTWPVDILTTYLTVYGLFKWFLFSRKYFLFIIAFLITAFCAILVQRLIIFQVSVPIFSPGFKSTYGFWGINWFNSFTNIYMVVAIVSVIKLFMLTNKQQSNVIELDREKIEAELKFLKAQVHPHFLFNTLNNLYSLTLDKSDKAPEVVLKLSSLLNYMLYECNEPYILVNKEIALIENYIALERIRYGEQLDIQFRVSGEVTGKRIAPMLLLPFVENAFKHGVSKIRKEAFVKIELEMSGDNLEFTVRNSRSPISEKDTNGYSEGIGLKNVKRRLVLMYPGKFSLVQNTPESEFIIKLTVNLDFSYDRKMFAN